MRVLNQVASVFRHDFVFPAHPIEGPAIEAAGTPGPCPSAALGEGSRGLYESGQQSLPGRDAANPIPAILSAALMLRNSFALEHEAEAVERGLLSSRPEGIGRTGFRPPAMMERAAGD